MLAQQFGKNVRAARKACGLTQAKLSEAAHLSEEWVRRIERGVGAPSFDAIDALSRALSTSPAALFSTADRQARANVVEMLTADISDVEFAWLEQLLRAALRRPTG